MQISSKTISLGMVFSGLAGAIMLPLLGLGIGVTQAIRGAINTPEAIRESLRGKIWDQASFQ